MTMRYWLDFTETVVHQVTATDSSLMVPYTSNADTVNNPNNVGSEWFISVDGSPVAVNIHTAAVFGTNAIIEPGSYLTVPLYLQPGTTLHMICAGSQTAIVSLIRARRAS